MKKYGIGFCISIIAILATLGIMYGIDMSRIKNNEPVIFCNWGNKYVAPEENVESESFYNGVIIGNGSVNNRRRLHSKNFKV